MNGLDITQPVARAAAGWLAPEEGERLIRVLVGRYKRLGVPFAFTLEDDLVQEGRVALLRAERTFDPTVGTDPIRFAWRALVLYLGTFLARFSSPASGDSTKAGRPNRAMRAPIDDDAFEADGGFDALEAHEWDLQVRARLRELSADEDAIRVALDIATPTQRAEETGRPVKDIYKATHRLRKRATQDVVLWQLMQAKRGSQ